MQIGDVVWELIPPCFSSKHIAAEDALENIGAGNGAHNAMLKAFRHQPYALRH